MLLPTCYLPKTLYPIENIESYYDRQISFNNVVVRYFFLFLLIPFDYVTYFPRYGFLSLKRNGFFYSHLVNRFMYCYHTQQKRSRCLNIQYSAVAPPEFKIVNSRSVDGFGDVVREDTKRKRYVSLDNEKNYFTYFGPIRLWKHNLKCNSYTFYSS